MTSIISIKIKPKNINEQSKVLKIMIETINVLKRQIKDLNKLVVEIVNDKYQDNLI